MNVRASARILIVDDQPDHATILETLLRQAGYTEIKLVGDSRLALSSFVDFMPDLVFLDWRMPDLDGSEVMKQIKSRVPEGEFLPVVVLTADNSPAARKEALERGASDFLMKPFDPSEVMTRARNLLETRELQLQLKQQNQMLEVRVRERTRELANAQVEIIERLAQAGEYRDDATATHNRRVAAIAARIALHLGLESDEVELIRHAALLHDVGKIGIPDHILLKGGSLTEAESEVIKTHTVIGAKLLSGSRYRLLQMAEEIALTHHEHWDGSGYAGMRGEEIPLIGRIVVVADVFDALTTERTYKPAWSVDAALQEIRDRAGSEFDPLVVDALIAVVEAALALDEGFLEANGPA